MRGGQKQRLNCFKHTVISGALLELPIRAIGWDLTQECWIWWVYQIAFIGQTLMRHCQIRNFQIAQISNRWKVLSTMTIDQGAYTPVAKRSWPIRFIHLRTKNVRSWRKWVAVKMTKGIQPQPVKSTTLPAQITQWTRQAKDCFFLFSAIQSVWNR